jgi:hypothetical protein
MAAALATAGRDPRLGAAAVAATLPKSPARPGKNKLAACPKMKMRPAAVRSMAADSRATTAKRPA